MTLLEQIHFRDQQQLTAMKAKMTTTHLGASVCIIKYNILDENVERVDRNLIKQLTFHGERS